MEKAESLWLIDEAELPASFRYPPELKRIIKLGLTNLVPSIFFEKGTAKERMEGLKERYHRDLIPFAQKIDCEDIVCFEAGSGLVYLIEDFDPPGFEVVAVFPNVWEWLRRAVDDLIEYAALECDAEKCHDQKNCGEPGTI